MTLNETLTSLAMLKVNIDQGKDYLDYLRPFILQVFIDHRPDPITDQRVSKLIREQFGLEIPARTVQLVLRRLARSRLLKREEGVYHTIGTLPDPGIGPRKSEANRHIEAVIAGLLDFAQGADFPIMTTRDEAVKAICEFLSHFNIPCLRAYLRGTTIPVVEDTQQKHVVLVSHYVVQLQQNSPERFESFLVMLRGLMLANALLCPDLQNLPKTYKGVKFFLDTPLLIQQLGLEGEPKRRAISEMVALLRKLGAKVATFFHLREELVQVVKGAAHYVDKPDGRGAIVYEARRNGTTKSDLLLIANKIDELLVDAGIEVNKTPDYIERFQIDEPAFEYILQDDVNYYNPNARLVDINSVRSIYVLRVNMSPASVEGCKAVLVSSNTDFAQAAYKYGQRHAETREVSSVITDFSLANMAWLKAPMGAPSIVITELLAYAYAALCPSDLFLNKTLLEIEKLQEQGKISERDHQLLRSSTIAHDELMRLTLGNEAALSERMIIETLRRVTAEIKKEETEKTKQEQESHRQTQQQLTQAMEERESLKKRVYWKCARNSNWCAWAASITVFAFLVLGMAVGFGLKTQNPMVGWLLLLGSLVLTIASLANLLFGTTVQRIRERIHAKCLTYFLRREAKATGIEFGEEG